MVPFPSNIATAIALFGLLTLVLLLNFRIAKIARHTGSDLSEDRLDLLLRGVGGIAVFAGLVLLMLSR